MGALSGVPRELAVSFTGHRPPKLPWGYDESDPRCVDFKRRLRAEIRASYENGYRYFLSGMADGVDLYAAEAVIGLKSECPGMELVCVYPFGTGSDERRWAINAEAAKIVSLYDAYCTGCYSERNSSKLICGFSGDAASGTGATIRMALREDLRVSIISV